ncbi:class I SAM-dependent methyltransferase [Amycolatopsis sp. EV170708-02-1]|uniref:class I SAM-dependent methyltransferase n=1 Tax=Amycolatopsis sp. EV170708-02-1 TaxID=2919322 RepID=UPI001F0C0753|nr:methyltransferase domain-containing protein [Amycolatopsis sp. EV170708-02-1]UMP00216.1 methyltransferase domain-containing protein [Amycolatopsis sp. EV170708-02-1]
MTKTGGLFTEHVLPRLVRQFGHPRGPVGQVVGWIMANSESNRRRNGWVVSLLEIRPTDRVLEIGFGPGLAIAELADLAGRVHGIDHSAAMVRKATRRNSRAIRDGRVRLVRASVDRLPEFGDRLDVIMAVNSAKFWAEPAARLRDLRRLLRPSGRIALAIQPRCPGADGATTAQAAKEHHDLLAEAGFTAIRVETLDLDPPVACLLAVNPG